MKINDSLLFGDGNLLDPLMAEQTGDLYVIDEQATKEYLKQSEADNVKRAEMKQIRSINPAMAIQGLVAMAQQTANAPKETEKPVEEKTENADEVIARIESIQSVEELEAMKLTEKRKGVLKEIDKRIEKLKA